eukprot:Clim_evm14s159 gene=Clim_evmTU14s159
MAGLDITTQPHRRLNILTGRWILCSPHRLQRPWQGQKEKTQADDRPDYDPNCYLCPGNTRSNGSKNEKYNSTFVFTNDFAAVIPNDTAGAGYDRNGLIKAEGVTGTCRVVCFSPQHNKDIKSLSDEELGEVIQTWKKETEALEGKYPWVQIFENKGAVMGCSNPHPHGQIWATEHCPEEINLEVIQFQKHHKERGQCIMCSYMELEVAEKVRIVSQNQHFVAVVPFWAYWPFEILVMSTRHFGNVQDISSDETHSLSQLLREICEKYDKLFSTRFPYAMGIHQAPKVHDVDGTFHFHFHFYPPLLRSATVKKFMAGYELLADLSRDITAEKAAEAMRPL